MRLRSIEDIVELVSRETGIPAEELCQTKERRDLAMAARAAVFFLSMSFIHPRPQITELTERLSVSQQTGSLWKQTAKRGAGRTVRRAQAIITAMGARGLL